MNKKATIEFSTSFVIKLILGLFTFLIILSFFTKIIPFFSDIPFFGKLLILVSIFVIYDNLFWILVEIGKN
jgi:hypothetical protein